MRRFAFLLCLGWMGCDGGTDCESGAADFDISEALTDEEWSGVQDFWGEADTEEYYCRYACGQVINRIYGWELPLERCVMDVPEPTNDDLDTGMTAEIDAVVTCEGTMVEESCD